MSFHMVSSPDVLFYSDPKAPLIHSDHYVSEGLRTRAEFNFRLEKIVSNMKRMSLERLPLSPKKTSVFKVLGKTLNQVFYLA